MAANLASWRKGQQSERVQTNHDHGVFSLSLCVPSSLFAFPSEFRDCHWWMDFCITVWGNRFPWSFRIKPRTRLSTNELFTDVKRADWRNPGCGCVINENEYWIMCNNRSIIPYWTSYNRWQFASICQSTNSISQCRSMRTWSRILRYLRQI